MNPTVSLVICTYKRYDLVTNAIRSIETAGVFFDSFFEVIVIENTPVAERQPFQGLPPQVQVVTCDKVGLSAARNRALRVAKGRYIAYLDDDMLMKPSWPHAVKAVVNSKPDVRAFGGRVSPKFIEEPGPWFYPKLAEFLSCVDWDQTARYLNKGEWIVGANMIISTEILNQVGGFNENLGRIGSGGLLSNEETALFRAIGMENVFYDPDIWIDHVIPPERTDPRWFHRRTYWQAVSDVLSGETWMSRDEAERRIRTATVKLPAELRNFRAVFEPPADVEMMKAQMDIIYAMGMLLGR